MLAWPAIDTVLLDMDGTLLDLHFDNYFWMEYLPRVYAAHHAISEAESRAHLYGTFSAERGSLQWYCLDHWSARLEMDIAQLKREVRQMIKLRPFVIEFLSRLHKSTRRVLMVTNAHRETLSIKMRTKLQ